MVGKVRSTPGPRSTLHIGKGLGFNHSTLLHFCLVYIKTNENDNLDNYNKSFI